MPINQRFSVKTFGNGGYRPDFLAFFPKLARGHAISRDGRCAVQECQRNNPRSKVKHEGGNVKTWQEERGINTENMAAGF